jgi:FKBP-type peptidyl-prolyl cis-trans isomerase SlyD
MIYAGLIPGNFRTFSGSDRKSIINVKKITMTVSDDKVVTVRYTLFVKKGDGPEEMAEETTPDHPFVFLCGHGGVLTDFEGALTGKKKGDTFDFRLTSAKGYGDHEKDYVVKIDRQAFHIDGKFDEERVKVGRELEMSDSEGNPLTGKVTGISDKEVEMDFNHPLAGYELHFTGEILDVREATREELEHGHVHGPGGHHHH